MTAPSQSKDWIIPLSPTGSPKADFARRKVGDITVTTLLDGWRTVPLAENFVRNASSDQVNDALEAAGMPRGQMTIHFNPVLIETAGKRVLIDTGHGEKANQAEGSTIGFTLRSLDAAGIAPDSIELVIISHCHGDHVNGLLRADGSPAYPNAEITVSEPEWSYWMDDAEMERAQGRISEIFEINRKAFAPVKERVRTHQDGEKIVPGITAVFTPGHTIGHTSYKISSGGETLFVQADVTNNPALFVRNPGWRAAFDQFPEQAEATRRRIYDMLADERIPVQGFHYPFPSRAMVDKDGDRYRVAPID